GCSAMNGGFCQLPSGFCVQRHTHHCLRAINGANAFGSLAKSPWYVIGVSLRVMGATDPLLTWQRRPRTQPLTGRRRFPSKPNLIIEVVINLSRIDCRYRGSYRLCCRLPVTLRCRDAHPQCRFHFAAEFRHCRKHLNDFADPAVAGIAKGATKRAVVC